MSVPKDAGRILVPCEIDNMSVMCGYVATSERADDGTERWQYVPTQDQGQA